MPLYYEDGSIYSQLMGLQLGEQLVEAGSSLEEQLHWTGCRCAWLYLQKGMGETWLGSPTPGPGPTSTQTSTWLHSG